MFFQQRQLPHWARRTNPHVWRHLSRTSAGNSIDLSRLRRAFLISTGVALALPVLGHLVTLSASTPLSALLSSPIIIVTYTWLLGTLIGLPIAIALYGIILVRVGTHAASLMLRERASDGLDVLRSFLALFPSARPYAVGRVAQRALAEIGIDATYIRHPSHGGKPKFMEGVAALKPNHV